MKKCPCLQHSSVLTCSSLSGSHISISCPPKVLAFLVSPVSNYNLLVHCMLSHWAQASRNRKRQGQGFQNRFHDLLNFLVRIRDKGGILLIFWWNYSQGFRIPGCLSTSQSISALSMYPFSSSSKKSKCIKKKNKENELIIHLFEIYWQISNWFLMQCCLAKHKLKNVAQLL